MTRASNMLGQGFQSFLHRGLQSRKFDYLSDGQAAKLLSIGPASRPNISARNSSCAMKETHQSIHIELHRGLLNQRPGMAHTRRNGITPRLCKNSFNSAQSMMSWPRSLLSQSGDLGLPVLSCPAQVLWETKYGTTPC